MSTADHLLDALEKAENALRRVEALAARGSRDYHQDGADFARFLTDLNNELKAGQA